jgi:hypothetical protein
MNDMFGSASLSHLRRHNLFDRGGLVPTVQRFEDAGYPGGPPCLSFPRRKGSVDRKAMHRISSLLQ